MDIFCLKFFQMEQLWRILWSDEKTSQQVDFSFGSFLLNCISIFLSTVYVGEKVKLCKYK